MAKKKGLVLEMSRVDCIDSSIILGILFEEDQRCKYYLNNVGYKGKNKGMLTVPLIGEIFTNLFLKLPQRINDPLHRKVFIQDAVDFFDETIMRFLRKEKLLVKPMEAGDFQHITTIKEVDYMITDDDAVHLSTAVNKKCQRFITTDDVLLKSKEAIKKEFNLIIADPTRI